MRIPNTERLQYFNLQLDHFEPVEHRDLVRRSNWTPGYYGLHVPLLTPTLDTARPPLHDGGRAGRAPPRQPGRKPDAGETGP